jgi:hypothetical protein
MKIEMEMIPCTSCTEPMPKLRKELYGYSFCIKCSTVLPKVGRTVTCGEGDHTWNEVEILDQDVAKRILELERMIDANSLLSADLLDYNEESEDSTKYRSIGAVREIVKPVSDTVQAFVEEEEDQEEETSTEEDDIFTTED